MKSYEANELHAYFYCFLKGIKMSLLFFLAFIGVPQKEI